MDVKEFYQSMIVSDIFKEDSKFGKRSDTSWANIKALVKFINLKCPTIISSIKRTDTFLYRGIDKAYGANLAFLGTSPTNRDPYGLSEAVSDGLNEVMIKQGFKAIRSNSIFCTSDLEFLQSKHSIFGEAYLIFPIDPFDYTWSPIVDDINYDIFKDNHIAKYYIDLFKKTLNLNNLRKFIKDAEYKNTDLDDALKSHCEIMIHGKYLALDANKYGYDLTTAIRNT